jgi:hypothetical protein
LATPWLLSVATVTAVAAAAVAIVSCGCTKMRVAGAARYSGGSAGSNNWMCWVVGCCVVVT